MNVRSTTKPLVLLAALLLAACVPRVVISNEGKVPGATPGEEVVRLVNLQRKKAGLAPLKPDSHVTEASTAHAVAMARNSCVDYKCAGHTAKERLSFAGYRAQYSKFFVTFGHPTPAEFVRAVMSESWGRELVMHPGVHHIGAAWVAGNWTVGVAAPAFELGDVVGEVVRLTNIEREKHGIAPLTIRKELNVSAQFHSDYIATNDCFAHKCPDEPDVDQRITNTGYQWTKIGENVAAGQIDPAEVVDNWMHSKGHRANILNPEFSEIGIGYTLLDRDEGAVSARHYWVQNFGRPRAG